MSHPDWLQRIISEKAELDQRIADNATFIDSNPRFKALPDRAQTLQRRQLDEQRALSKTLGERIEFFTE